MIRSLYTENKINSCSRKKLARKGPSQTLDKHIQEDNFRGSVLLRLARKQRGRSEVTPLLKIASLYFVNMMRLGLGKSQFFYVSCIAIPMANFPFFS